MNDRKFRILLAIRYPASDILKKVLGDKFEVVEKTIQGEEEYAEEMKKDYDAIIGSVYIPVTGDMIRSMSPKVKAIATLSVGFDHIDIDAAEERGVKVLTGAVDGICASTYAVAEHAFTILLNVVGKVFWHSNAVKEGTSTWLEMSGGRLNRDLWGKEFFGSNLGVIGVGRIGSHISRIARGFQMKVTGYDPYVDKEKVLESGVDLVENLKELLFRSDFIILSPCLTDETKGIIGQPEIDLMKDGVCIANIARGALVNEEAILRGLRDGKIKGYATDCLTVEPPTEENSPLLAAFRRGEFPNLLISPHIAWLTEKTPPRYATIIANRIKETLTGKYYPHIADYLKM